MSHTSFHLNSFAHAAPRYAKSAAGDPVDPLGEKAHATYVAAVYPLKREIRAKNTVALGEEVIYELPKSGYLSHIALKNGFGTTTTVDMSDYPAFAAIKEIRLYCDNDEIQHYRYKPVIDYYLTQLPNEESVDKVLAAAGGTACGTSSAAIMTMAPVPLFFDPIICPGVAPLNLAKFSKSMELRVTYEAAADIVLPTAGGADLASSVMVLYMHETVEALRAAHKTRDTFYNALDFGTLPAKVVATATKTDVDVSGLKGQIKRYYIRSNLTTNLTTAHVFFANQEIGEIIDDLDGSEEYVFKHKEEGEFDYLMYNHGRGYSSTLGYPYLIPYTYTKEKASATHNVGGLHSGTVNNHNLYITHAVGANCTLDIVALRSAIFVFSEGSMQRIK